MLTSFLCFFIELMYELPQMTLNNIFGFIGLEAPQLPDFFGSFFGCNV